MHTHRRTVNEKINTECEQNIVFTSYTGCSFPTFLDHIRERLFEYRLSNVEVVFGKSSPSNSEIIPTFTRGSFKSEKKKYSSKVIQGVHFRFFWITFESDYSNTDCLTRKLFSGILPTQILRLFLDLHEVLLKVNLSVCTPCRNKGQCF